MCRAHVFEGPAMPDRHVERRNPLYKTSTSASSLESWDGEAPGPDGHDHVHGRTEQEPSEGHAAVPYEPTSSDAPVRLRVRTYTTGYDAYGHGLATSTDFDTTATLATAGSHRKRPTHSVRLAERSARQLQEHVDAPARRRNLRARTLVKNAERELQEAGRAPTTLQQAEPDWEGDTYTEQEESERIFRDLNRDSMSEEDMLVVLECF